MKLDIHSETWAAVVAWCETEIAAAQRELERPGLDATATEFQRGRLSAARAILKLPVTGSRPLMASAPSYT